MNTEKSPEPWSVERGDELDSLVSLLREVASLNNGSSFIDRLQKCIETAQKLTTHNRAEGRCRVSFAYFLQRQEEHARSQSQTSP